MLDTLIFSLNSVMPFFILILAGVLAKQTGFVPKEFFKYANSFVYKLALPLQLFGGIAFSGTPDTVDFSFMLYAAIITVSSFMVIWGVTELAAKDKKIVGTLVQGAFRGNFSLLGMPIASLVAGTATTQKAASALVVVIPLYNALSIIVLKTRGDAPKKNAAAIARDIALNPLIIASAAAVAALFLSIRLPQMAVTAITQLGLTATPIGLLSIGGLMEFADATARLKPALYSCAIKNLAMPATLMPLSYLLGYRGEELLVLLTLTAAPTAVSSYIMAAGTGGDAPLASNILIITTFVSAFVLAAGIYILKIMGMV